MGKFADLEIRGSATIDLANDCLRGGIADVVQPSLNRNFGIRFSEITKAEEIGVCRGIDPDSRLQFGGDGGSLRRVEAGAGDFENAGELEIVADDLGEEGGVGFGGVGTGNEVRDGDAGFVGVHADCGTEPVLGVRGSSEETEKNQEEE
jgi:hypothetical protein